MKRKNLIRINETQLKKIIMESVMKVIRENEEDDGIPSMEEYGGVDDYRGVPSSRDQWKTYRMVQGLDEPDDVDYVSREMGKLERFPRYHIDTDTSLDFGTLNGFQTDKGFIRQAALDDKYPFARRNDMFNGHKSVDKNNPSIEGDDSLPEGF